MKNPEAKTALKADRARLLLVDGDHDLRDALAPPTRTLMDFLRAVCAAPAVGASDNVA